MGVAAPIIDGKLDNDTGWNQAFRYNWQYGANSDAAKSSGTGGRVVSDAAPVLETGVGHDGRCTWSEAGYNQ